MSPEGTPTLTWRGGAATEFTLSLGTHKAILRRELFAGWVFGLLVAPQQPIYLPYPLNPVYQMIALKPYIYPNSVHFSPLFCFYVTYRL